jgi:hypothetical protein
MWLGVIYDANSKNVNRQNIEWDKRTMGTTLKGKKNVERTKH